MALADYFHRAAIATAQILEGFSEEAIRERLETASVGIKFSLEATRLTEGRTSLDLLVRLLARLYPSLNIHSPATALRDELAGLARSINPAIEILTDGEVAVLVAVGEVDAAAPVTIRVGSDAWTAYLSTDASVPVGDSSNPFGAGVGAALGASNVFRAVFLPNNRAVLDRNCAISTWSGMADKTPGPELDGVRFGGRNVLVGAGAIGNAVLWALARAPIQGTFAVVDAQVVELSNLQRYVLTSRNDVDRSKVEIADAATSNSPLNVEPYLANWATFVSENGYDWDRAVVALDSARDRRAVQASLPRWIANAWTQPGDLGVSVHPWTEDGACLSCLYLPEGALPSEDKLIAEALGVSGPERELQIRQALYAGQPAPKNLLEEAAKNLGVPLDDIEAFSSRPIRELYTEGICGGLVLPLDRVGRPQQNVHVPTAHQSALAGVLLAAGVAADAAGAGPVSTRVTRLNLLRPVPAEPTQPAQKDPRGICVCQDDDYRNAYQLKYSSKGRAYLEG
jgi:hypothetical protein